MAAGTGDAMDTAGLVLARLYCLLAPTLDHVATDHRICQSRRLAE